jgi:hypothetical protein
MSTTASIILSWEQTLLRYITRLSTVHHMEAKRQYSTQMTTWYNSIMGAKLTITEPNELRMMGYTQSALMLNHWIMYYYSQNSLYDK